MKKIDIPNINRDDRIGSVFNVLFRIINDINACNLESNIILDFSGRTFFHPFFLAPLAIYLDTSDKRVRCDNICNQIQSYMDAIAFKSPRMIGHATDVDRIIDGYRSKRYTPICKFSTHSEDRDVIESKIQYLVEIQSKAGGNAKMPLSYMFSELITNIVEHSQSEYGYIYSQYLPTEGCVDICIADNGITIFGSFVEANKYIELIQGNPAKALHLAVGGYSTKDKPNAENRGYGISSSIKILVNGLNGAFFILSGNAFYRHDRNGAKIAKLPENIEWDGTIVLLRVPIRNVPADFDCYKYLE